MVSTEHTERTPHLLSSKSALKPEINLFEEFSFDLDGVSSHTDSLDESPNVAVCERFRQEYLSCLASGDIPPAVILTGSSGAGKNYLISLLEDIGAEQSTRLISRPRRPCDSEKDICWNGSHEDILVAYKKHGHRYGFSRSDLEDGLAKGVSKVLVAGDVGKISSFNKALSHALPLMPVINVRLDVPSDVLRHRLEKKRCESFDGESQQRVASNELFQRWESGQIASLKSTFNLHSIINLSEDEMFMLGYNNDQIRCLDSELVHDLFRKFFSECEDQVREHSLNLLNPMDILSCGQDVSSDLIDVLDNQLAEVAEGHVEDVMLKGGLAASLYLHSAWSNKSEAVVSGEEERTAYKGVFNSALAPISTPHRPVSPDIDWTMLFSSEQADAHANLLRALTNNSDLNYVENREKPVFHSLKIQSETESNSGARIELDVIAISRVQPDSSGFTFEFVVDDYLYFHRRSVVLPSGRTLPVVCPELLLIEKLVAGRGQELGKFDLYDAMGIALTQRLDVTALQHIIEQQSFQGVIDGFSEVELEQPTIGDVTLRLQQLGFQNKKLISNISARMVDSYLGRQNANEADSPMLPLQWTCDNLKQLKLIDRLLTSLEKISQELTTPEHDGHSSLEQTFGRGVTEKACIQLSDYFLHLATYQIGRMDVFVNQNSAIDISSIESLRLSKNGEL